nr:PREDICTED: zinc finger protein OZF-like [Bemisia tabaci]XP_018904917.1 PREDICTED: zinc finger protein OZF-like [Bemisia tabaci]
MKTNRETSQIPKEGEKEQNTEAARTKKKKMVAAKKDLAHQCPKCSKRFSVSYYLKKHLRIHSGERPFACNLCPKRFGQKSTLINHQLCVHQIGEAKKFPCPYCERVFPMKDRLKLHIRVHTGEKPHKCCFCKQRFARGSQVIQHMRKHSQARPYECDDCGAKFAARITLALHCKRHLGVLDYVCNICGKAFLRADGLQKHITSLHYNVKAFKCKICNQQFKGHILQHLQTHRKEKPFKCQHCPATFIQKSQLKVHERKHTGEKPYECQFCHKTFGHSTVLNMHVRKHTGERPFKCLICENVAFFQLPHLKKHMKSIHKTDCPYYCVTCKTFFKAKSQLIKHESDCCPESASERKFYTAPLLQPTTNSMPITRMRLLLAVLLKRISTPERLSALGFGKRLIDEVLCESIKNSGRKPIVDDSLNEMEILKKNIEILLDWTIPRSYMQKFKTEKRSMEELLEELTS